MTILYPYNPYKLIIKYNVLSAGYPPSSFLITEDNYTVLNEG
jgi:hypothetical protein